MVRMLTVFVFAGAALGGVAAAETAREILDRQQALDQTVRRWNDRHERLRMEVHNPGRSPRAMELDLFDKKYPDDEQRTMVFFSAPPTVKGTAFLAHTHKRRAADQWLYLPELKRARRIGGETRKSGFVGTDFTYHDLDLLTEMPSWTEADAAASLRGEETIGDTPCHVIEYTPQREDIGYARIVLWLGHDDLVARQVEFYEQAPSSGWFGLGGAGALPVRRMRQSDLRLIGTIPVAHRAEVETPGAGSTTTVTFEEVAFDVGLPDDLFGQPAMEWGGYRPGKSVKEQR